MLETKVENLDGVVKTTFANGQMSFQSAPTIKKDIVKEKQYLINCGKNTNLFLHFVGIIKPNNVIADWKLETYAYDDYTLSFDENGKYLGWCYREYYNGLHNLNYFNIEDLNPIKDAKKINDLINGKFAKNVDSRSGLSQSNLAENPYKSVVVKIDKDIINKLVLPKRDSNGRFISNKIKQVKKKIIKEEPIKYKIAHFNYEDNYGCMTYNRRVAVTKVSNDHLEGYDFARAEHRQFKLDKIAKFIYKWEEADDLPRNYQLKVDALNNK